MLYPGQRTVKDKYLFLLDNYGLGEKNVTENFQYLHVGCILNFKFYLCR